MRSLGELSKIVHALSDLHLARPPARALLDSGRRRRVGGVGLGHAMRASTDAASAIDAGPARVGVPREIVDAFVMMRVAELVCDGLVGTAIDRALAHAGNGGSSARVERADAIRAALIGIRATW